MLNLDYLILELHLNSLELMFVLQDTTIWIDLHGVTRRYYLYLRVGGLVALPIIILCRGKLTGIVDIWH
jgi:hypothetical protein